MATVVALATGLAWSAAGAPGATAAQSRVPDLQRGADIYDDECADCHSLTPGKIKKATSLFGIIGAMAGQAPGFEYSPSIHYAEIVWTPEALDAYLAAPKTFLPGTSMKFDGLANPLDRADLIAFLQRQR